MPAPAAKGGMGDMMEGMMGGEGEGEHGSRTASPYFSQLLAPTTPEDHSRLMAQAFQRMEQGRIIVAQVAATDQTATDAETRRDAARRLREGADLYVSGAAALAALDGSAPQQRGATDWFRDQMRLGEADPHAAQNWFGLSPSHLLLMLFLGVVSALLLALQVARLRRVSKLAAEKAKSPPGSFSHAVAPQPSGAARSVTPAPVALAPSNSVNAAGASLRKPRSWNGQLRVVQIVRETPTVQTFRLADPSADRLPFDFLPGQFIQVEVESPDGKAARRSYTVASSPTQRAYVELTVKREEQGVVSRYLHDELKVGDLLKVTGPFGDFTFTGTNAESIVLIAGGVGITPMMSVLRYLTDTAWPGEIFFVYGARSTEEFVFREELERLERRFPKLHVLAAMQRTPGTAWLGPEGPITREMLKDAVPEIARRRIHLCGPPGMMAAMRKELDELGVPETQLYTEAFGPASLPADPDALEVVSPPSTGIQGGATSAGETGIAQTTITFSVAGVSVPLPADQTILEAAETAGVEIPYACRVGTCGACVTKLLAGEVAMDVETGLAPEDKANGFVLACQAKSTGQALVVEA